MSENHEILHICFLTHEYPPGTHGGIGSFTKTLARGLVKHNHLVTVIGMYQRKSTCIEDDCGVRVIRVPYFLVPKVGPIINAKRLRNAIHKVHTERNIDILEAPNLELGLLSRSSPGTKILRIHTTISTYSRKGLFRSWQIWKSFRNAEYLCAVSQFSAKSNRYNLKLGDRHIEIIPNPVDTNIFFPKSTDAELSGSLLFVGTLNENKGVNQLLKAMSYIVDAVPSAQLWLVGRDSVDPRTGRSFIDSVKKSIPRRLDSHISFKGTIQHSEIPKIISKAQICVYPSHMENMPVAWLEAMAMGKAIVASSTGPGPEVIEDLVSGLLCDPHDPKSIAGKVIKLFNDPELRLFLGLNARHRIKKFFSLDVLVKRNEVFYRHCIESNLYSNRSISSWLK